ncbi:MAG: 30S ribosomal protein S3 [Elusimicrobiota bacterium]
MGHKVPPKAVRLGYIEQWESKWYAPKRDIPDLIEEDYKIRELLKEKLKYASVSRIGIERPGKMLKINIFTARPGLVIGRRGTEIETLRTDLENKFGKKVGIYVLEIKQPEIDAQLVADGIAMQIERRISQKRAMKMAIERAMQNGALGIKIMVGGRLGGNEIARTEWAKDGRVPLQTFRALIDFAKARAYNTYGVTGIKVWVFRKEFYKKTDRELLDDARPVSKEQIEQLEKVELNADKAEIIVGGEE